MNGLFGNFSMMNPQGGQGQLSGFGRGVGGYQMPMNVQIPQQDLSSYYNKPFGDFDANAYSANRNPMSRIIRMVATNLFNRNRGEQADTTT